MFAVTPAERIVRGCLMMGVSVSIVVEGALAFCVVIKDAGYVSSN